MSKLTKLMKLKKSNLEKQKIYLFLLQKNLKEEKQYISSYMAEKGLKEIPKLEDIDDVEFLETLQLFESHSVEVKYLEKIIKLKERELQIYLN